MSSLSREGDFSFELDTENAECVIFPDSDAEDLPARVTYSLESEGGYEFSGNTVIEIEFDKSTGKVSGLTADGVSINVKNAELRSPSTKLTVTDAANNVDNNELIILLILPAA